MNTEQLAAGVTREHQDEGRIVVFTVSTVSHDALDIYAHYASESANETPAGEAFLVLHDFTRLPTITPYLRDKLDKMMRAFHDGELQVYAAWVVAEDMYGHLASMYVTRTLVHQENVERHVFHDRDEALKWLQSKLT